MGLLARHRSSRFSSRYQEQDLTPQFDLILWGVPVALIGVSGLLIASTQRQVSGDGLWLGQGTTGATLLAVLLLVSFRTGLPWHRLSIILSHGLGLSHQPSGAKSRITHILSFPPVFFSGVSATLIILKLVGVDGLWLDHWATGIVGLVLAMGLSQISPEIWSLRSYQQEQWQPGHGLWGPSALLLALLLVGTIGALLAVNLVGTEALGAQRWLAVGPFQVQPSEFAKLSTIILGAAILDRFPIKTPLGLLRPFGVILVPWALVLIQPDLGTSLVFGAVLVGMLYWSTMPWQWLLVLLSPLPTALLSNLYQAGQQGIFLVAQIIWIAAMVTMAWCSLPWRWISGVLTAVGLVAVSLSAPWLWEHGLKDYQRDRLLLFLNPSMDPLGGGYHLIQSIVGIGSGRFLGTGLLQGQLTRLQFIPEQHTDFIFSALGEELGLMGCFLVILGFAIWSWRLLKIAAEAKTDFESLLVIGILSMVIFQVVVNVFMTTGLGPITGIPLPFMSYGRSALLMNCLGLGLVAAVERRCRQPRFRS